MSSVEFDAAEHKIKAVTIYSSKRAEVVRTFNVKLEVGQNEVTVTSLPSCIDLDATRVTGLGDAILFDVACSLVDEDNTLHQSAEERGLVLARTALANEKRVHERKADILMLFGRSLTGEFATPATVTSFLSQFQDHSVDIISSVADLDAKIAELDEAISKLKRESAKKQKRSKTNAKVTAVIMAKRAGEVEITLTYIVNDSISWTPSYDLRASTEGGRPPRSVSLHYRASIVQNTGEDWKNVSLILSTATPGSFAHVPKIHSVRVAPFSGYNQARPFGAQNNAQSGGFVAFGQKSTPSAAFGTQPLQQNTSSGLFMNAGPPPAPLFGGTQNAPAPAGGLFGTAARSDVQQQQMQQPTLFGSAASTTATVGFGSAQQPAQTAAEDTWTTVDVTANTVDEVEQTHEQPGDEAAGSWAESGTTVTDSAVSSSFHIDGLCSIPSEKTPHKVTIAVLTFDALVQYVAVPRAKAAAFLQCEVTNSSGYRLLPGSVHVYLDNMHVSKTSISDVNPEEKFKCTLGSDPALRITYVRKPRNITTTTTAFSAQTTCSKYHVTTTLQNTHSFAVKDVILRDVVPLPPDVQGVAMGTLLQSIRVVLKEPKGLSDAKPKTLVNAENKSTKGRSSNVKVRWAGTNGDKTGKYEWVVSVGAGEEIRVEAVIEIHSPSHFNWQLVQENE